MTKKCLYMLVFLVTIIILVIIVVVKLPSSPKAQAKGNLRQTGSLKLVGSLATKITDIKIRNGYGYGISEGFYFNKIIDVSDPSTPREINYDSSLSVVKAIEIPNDDLLYVATSAHLRVFSLSDPTAPVQINEVGTGIWGPSRFEIHDNLLIDNSGRIFDISVPVSPTLLSNIDSDDTLFISDNYVYGSELVFGDGTYLEVFDISSLTSPTRVNYLKIDDHPSEVNGFSKLSDKYLVASSFESRSIIVIDISHPKDPSVVSRLEIEDSNVATPIKFVDSVGFMICRSFRLNLCVYDFSDPLNPFKLASKEIASGAVYFEVKDKYIYVPENNLLEIFEFTSAESPTPTPTPTITPTPTPPNPDPIDIKIRAFIPCGAVTSPIGDLFGGDNRSFSYSGGQSRFEEHLIVTMDPTFANPIIERPSSRYWESTRLYTSLDDAGQQNGTGNQEWCRQLISSPSVPEIRPASIGSFDRPAYGGKLQSGEGVAIEFFMEAGNAFLGGIPPKLDANIVVFLRQNEGNEPEYRIYGKHDGFPAYEIYLNQQLVYCHDPIRSGDSPSSLFGGLGFGGITADTRAWKEIQAIDCSPIKGIRTNSPIGEKGSKFTVTGNGFNSSNMLSANSVATITSTVSVYINNVLLGEVNLDENGKFQVVLDTANASYGIYEVVASNNITTTTFSTEFQLQADSFLIQELDGVATSFSIPPDIAYPPFSIFLPNIQR